MHIFIILFQFLTDVCSLFFSLFLSIKETSVIVIRVRIRWGLTRVIKATRVICARMHVRSYQWRINVALELEFRARWATYEAYPCCMPSRWHDPRRFAIASPHSYITPIRGVHSFTLSETRQRGWLLRRKTAILLVRQVSN